jgi:hypothetical protein
MRLSPSALAPLSALVALPLLACLQQVSTGTGTTDPTASGTTAAVASTGTTTPAGAGCSTDPASQITLCEQTSLCPGVSVDQGTLSGCGFRIHAGAVIDLECLCGEELCPIGVPDTCAQATQLLSSQTSSLVVCEQASNGTCEQVGASDAGTATSPSVSTCDKTCETECAGEPDCIQLCGC